MYQSYGDGHRGRNQRNWHGDSHLKITRLTNSLHHLTKLGEMEIIKKQLESGVEDVKFRRNNSMPPLHYAGIEGYHEVLSFF